MLSEYNTDQQAYKAGNANNLADMIKIKPFAPHQLPVSRIGIGIPLVDQFIDWNIAPQGDYYICDEGAEGNPGRDELQRLCKRECNNSKQKRRWQHGAIKRFKPELQIFVKQFSQFDVGGGAQLFLRIGQG